MSEKIRIFHSPEGEAMHHAADEAGKVSTALSGFIKPGFEAVQEAFIENFTRRQGTRPA